MPLSNNHTNRLLTYTCCNIGINADKLAGFVFAVCPRLKAQSYNFFLDIQSNLT